MIEHHVLREVLRGDPIGTCERCGKLVYAATCRNEWWDPAESPGGERVHHLICYACLRPDED